MTRISAVTEAKYLTSRKHKDESSRGWPFDRRRPKKMQLSHHNNNCKTRLNSTVKLLSAVSKISRDARQFALKAKNMKKSRALLSIIRFLSRALLPVMKLCYFIVCKAVSQVLSPAWSWEKKHAQQLTFGEIEFIIDKEIFLKTGPKLVFGTKSTIRSMLDEVNSSSFLLHLKLGPDS